MMAIDRTKIPTVANKHISHIILPSSISITPFNNYSVLAPMIWLLPADKGFIKLPPIRFGDMLYCLCSTDNLFLSLFLHLNHDILMYLYVCDILPPLKGVGFLVL
jgi:hypothetical protein